MKQNSQEQDSIKLLAKKLKERKLSILTAESCTAGGISYALTSVAGSSSWFKYGIVSYSNNAKIKLLKVSPALINKYGSVSKQVAKAMAKGVLDNNKNCIALAVTGLAGPSNTNDKLPIGTVWIAIGQQKIHTVCKHFKGNREEVRKQIISAAIQLIILWLTQ